MRLVSKRTNLLLMLAVVLLMVLPLAFVHGKFGGSDDQGSAAVLSSRPGYKPWFNPVWTPPSPEIESLLFALQAGFGAGVIGYVLGRMHGAALAREAAKTPEPVDANTKNAPSPPLAN